MDRDDGVNDFLARIKELGAQRDREDEERTRQLEKEILAGRQARQNRRAERAKSLSPMKTGGNDRGSRVFDGIDLAHLRNLDSNTPDLRREDAVNDALDRLTGKSGPPIEDGKAFDSTPPIFPRERRPDSPWHRRPDSRGTVASETREESPRPESSRVDSENEYRRSFITRNLASKDIDFFKQTSERKIPSDVLLKNSDGRPSSIVPRKALPGMGKEIDKGPISGAPEVSSSHEPRKRSMTSYIRAHKSSPSMNGAGLPDLSKQNLFPTTEAMRFEPGGVKRGSVDDTKQPAMSPSQGRIDPDWKPPSVSKGMGTFVQSAMLKREGSINKRWSATLPGGIPRNSSPGSSQSRNSIMQPTERATTPVGNSRGSSPVPSEPPSTPEPSRRDMTNRGRAKSIVESLSKYSTSGIHPAVNESPKLETSPPTTPYNNHISKTFDQKRWSPTKASWLEVALKKGSEGGSPVLSKNAPVFEPPVKQTDHRPTVFPKPASMPSRSAMETVTNVTITSAALSQVTASSPRAVSDTPPALEKPTPLLPAKKLPPPVADKPSSVVPKPAPGPRVELDFRGNLKYRNSISSSPEKEDLPFLDVMSRLRSTRTHRYVAPNLLKDNILAGKAALQDAGPPKPKPPDPVKEKLMSAKGALKQSNSSTANLSEAVSKTKPPPPVKQASAPGRVEVVSIKPRAETLIDKRIPNLANLLSRGPQLYERSRSFSTEATSSSNNSSSVVNEESGTKGLGGDAPLSHMTKTRAKGPKRRQPTKTQHQDENCTKPSHESADSPDQELLPEAPISVPIRLPSISGVKEASAAHTEPVILGPRNPEPKLELEFPRDEPDIVKTKPPTPVKSPMLSMKTDLRPSPITTPIPSPSIEKTGLTFSLEAQQEAASELNHIPVTEALIETAFIERPIQPPAMGWLARRTSSARASGPQRTSFKLPQLDKVDEPTNTPMKSSSNLPMVDDEDDISELRPRALPHMPTVSNVKVREPLSAESGVRKVSYGSIPKHVDELNNFFKDPEAANIKVDIDVSQFIPLKATIQDKPHILKLDVWEMTAEGKVQALGPGQENTMYDENMYMCLHVFENALGEKGAEFYLWSGSQVSSAAVEDAQIFAKKMASENGATMTVVKQGHENPGFMNALGGILITRRGNPKSVGTGPHIFCGRSLYDGIVFDEEDMKNLSLCSGFPFLIHSGETVYLWKGIGSTPKELAYARKVANDLATGDVEDVDEGSEPQALVNIIHECLSDKAAAKYWAMKPAHDNYAPRLFCCNMQSDEIITEIAPFCQRDVELGNIYILDAFFEIYIVIGANSQSRRAEFQVALQFTQKYSKVAYSTESRPFLPPTFILLGGVSREFRAVFRGWQPSQIPTTWVPSRKPSLRVVGLDDAMRAMNMTE